MKSVNKFLTYKHFDLLFSIYLFEKTGELATYTKLHALFNERHIDGIKFRTVKAWANRLESKGYINRIDRYESSTTGGRRIESNIVTTAKGRAIITKFIRVCLGFAHLLPDFSLIEPGIKTRNR